MSFRTVDWSKIERRLQAVMGQLDYEDYQPLIDASIHYAYEDMKYWPRYLKLQPRTLERGYVQFSEDSYVVYGAGTPEVNGLYKRDGDLTGKPVYKHSSRSTAMNPDYDPSEVQYWIFWESENNRWGVFNANDDTAFYENADSGDTPPLTGWEVDTGEDPTPALEACTDIGTPLKVWCGDVLTNGATAPLDYYTDATGIRVPRGTGDVVWVAYKEELTDEYGNGTEGTVESIPYEFSEFAVYDTLYNLQFGRRQSQPNGYTLAYRKVTDCLDQQKLQVNEQTGYRFIEDRFKTMYGVDFSVR